ncbi:hypothetical protein [Streptomyces fildesensis]|uniref:hypothetical protein n=1 Tax=Streptomyces fildesensis TaxID=375757 RepID=UPI0018DF1534|nr:hypothetical protein [Streptomyces fildesensis]
MTPRCPALPRWFGAAERPQPGTDGTPDAAAGAPAPAIGRPTAVALAATGPGTGEPEACAPGTHRLGSTVLLCDPGAAAEQTDALIALAGRVEPVPGLPTVLVAVPDTAADALWPALGAALRRLTDEGCERVRLVMSGAAAGRPGHASPAQQLADAWRLTVVAPDAPAVVTPGGTLFVPDPASPGGGWWECAPGLPPAPLGRRHPAPAWQSDIARIGTRDVGGCVVEQIPAGLLLRPAESSAAAAGDLAFAVPADADRPTLLVGSARSRPVPAGDLAELLAALPARSRTALRLAPADHRDLLPAAYEVADLLGADIEVLTGLPLATSTTSAAPEAAESATRKTAVRRTQVLVGGVDGAALWRPFVESVSCAPVGADGIRPPDSPMSWRSPPIRGARPIGDGTFDLGDGWNVLLTRWGLWFGAGDGLPTDLGARPVNPETAVVVVSAAGTESAQDATFWLALTDVLDALEPDFRDHALLTAEGAFTFQDRHALRRLASGRRFTLAADQPRGHGFPTARNEAAAVTGAVRPERGTAPEPLPTSAAAPPTGTVAEPAAAVAARSVTVATCGVAAVAQVASSQASLSAQPAASPSATGGAATREEVSTAGRTVVPALSVGHRLENARSKGRSELPASVLASTAEPLVAPDRTASPNSVPLTGGESPAREPDGQAAATPPAPVPLTTSSATVPSFGGAQASVTEPAVAATGGPATAAASAAAVAAPVVRSAAPVPSSPASTPSRVSPLPVLPSSTPALPVSAPSFSPPAAESEAVQAESWPVPACTAADRAALRDLVGDRWERHAGAVSRAMVRMPALRARDEDVARVELGAAHLFLGSGDADPFGPEALVAGMRRADAGTAAYWACLTAGLRRLPVYRGPVLRAWDPGTDPAGGQETGGSLLVREPVTALPAASAARYLPAAVGRYAVHTTTGRRTGALLGAPDSGGAPEQIVILPGTRLLVCAVHPATGELPGRLLLHETPSGAGGRSLPAATLSRLEEAARCGTDVASSATAWPRQCTGRLGSYLSAS